MSQKPTIDKPAIGQPAIGQPVDQLRVLMEEFTRSGIATLHVRSGDFELLLSNDAAAPSLIGPGPQAATPVAAPSLIPAIPGAVPVAVPAPVAAASRVPDGAIIISAPNLGTFYRAPKPGAAAYVEIGGRVARGDEICLIEVMKLFTGVRAEASGTIVAVLAEDGAMVDAGQPLFALVAD